MCYTLNMTDKDLENINTVDVKVTAESMDAHVICLKDNGYKVQKNSSVWTRNTLFLLLGAFVMGSFFQ